jgi:hypothetical protein
MALWPVVAAAQPKEYQVKAAFLFNFAQFVEWPDSVFPSPDGPFYVGVLGDDPFGTALDDAVHGEAISGHKMVVQRSRQVADLKSCQMIFVSKSEKGRVPEILAAAGARPVLMVGDVSGFARSGGEINFFLEGAKVRFEINPVAALNCGLKFNSQLLSLGRIVTTAKEVK